MDAEEIKSLDVRHVVHTWSVNANVNPRVIASVDGLHLVDSQGQRYLDFVSQLKCVNVGHGNQKIIQAIQQQVELLCFVSTSFAVEPRSRLVKALAEVMPGDLKRFFFTLGGADANENAIKFARACRSKHKILAFYRSYHGATYGALSLTGDRRRTWAEPGIPGVVHLLNPFCYRCPFGLKPATCGLHCVEHVAEVIEYEDPATIAALIVEPVTGAGGIIIPPEGYMQRLREICDEYDILLIADEIMTGFGRTGRWFAMQHWDVVPDMMTVAKGLTASYLPMGAVALSEKVSGVLDHRMIYCGLTYSAHPVCCAAASATLEVYQEENLIENARVMGELLQTQLLEMKERHTCIGDARAIGLFGCLDLVKDRSTKEPINAKLHAKEISSRLMNAGLYSPLGSMQPLTILFITPPLCIDEHHLREGLSIIDEVLDYVDTLTEGSRRPSERSRPPSLPKPS